MRSRKSERGVSHDYVAQTLHYPDLVRAAKRPHSKRFEKAFSRRRRLAVIAEEKPIESGLSRYSGCRDDAPNQ